MSDRTVQESSLNLLSGKVSEAESILLRNGLTFKAIMFNVRIHNWNRYVYHITVSNYILFNKKCFQFVYFRALELAIKHKKYLNVIIYERRNYLKLFKKEEINEKLLKYSNVRDYIDL